MNHFWEQFRLKMKKWINMIFDFIFHMEEEDIVNEISALDRNIGVLADQIVQSLKNDMYFVAFCGLFTLAENTLIEKYREKKTFQALIQEAFDNNIIDEREKMILDNLRLFRKLTIHSDPQQTAYIQGDQIFSFTENSTYEWMMKRFSIDVLNSIKKIIKSK